MGGERVRGGGRGRRERRAQKVAFSETSHLPSLKLLTVLTRDPSLDSHARTLNQYIYLIEMRTNCEHI